MHKRLHFWHSNDDQVLVCVSFAVDVASFALSPPHFYEMCFCFITAKHEAGSNPEK